MEPNHRKVPTGPICPRGLLIFRSKVFMFKTWRKSLSSLQQNLNWVIKFVIKNTGHNFKKYFYILLIFYWLIVQTSRHSTCSFGIPLSFVWIWFLQKNFFSPVFSFLFYKKTFLLWNDSSVWRTEVKTNKLVWTDFCVLLFCFHSFDSSY